MTGGAPGAASGATLANPAIASTSLAASMGAPGSEFAMIAHGTVELLGSIADRARRGYAVDAATGEVFPPDAALPPGRAMFASVRIAFPDSTVGPADGRADGPGHVLDTLTKLSGNGWRLTFVPPLEPALDRSLAVLRARPQDIRPPRQPVAMSGPGVAIDGRGVLVGVVDFGCDFAHPAFLDAQGRTRLLFLWDQNAAGNASLPGAMREQIEIDAALLSPDPYAALAYWPDRNCYAPAASRKTELVHGTHVLGVAAGRGLADCPPGVAPGAALAFVHLRPGALVSSGDPADVFDGVCAIFLRSTQLGLPAIVNLSLGANWGSHDGNTVYDGALDALLARPGRAITVAAGNEREAKLNIDGTVVAGRPAQLRWAFGAGDRTANTLRIFSDASDGRQTIACSIRSGGVVVAGPLAGGGNAQRLQAQGGLEGVLYSGLSETLGGTLQQIEIRVLPSGAAEGLEIALSTESSTPVAFDAWIDRDDRENASQSHFETDRPVTESTLACTACGRKTLCVGAFEHRVASLPPAEFSAEGLTRDARRKPDVSAPGLDVLAAAAYGGRTTPGQPWRNSATVRMSGSSAAAPHAAGVLALMLQLSPGLSAEAAAQILRETARLDAEDNAIEWHKQLGFGRIDAAATIARLAA